MFLQSFASLTVIEPPRIEMFSLLIVKLTDIVKYMQNEVLYLT